MKVRIEELPQKILACKSARMSLAQNTTAELWTSFMANKKAIVNTLGTDLYSIQMYDNAMYFENFNPQTEFTKYAAIEVSDNKNIPNGFDQFILESGLFAVFLHQGLANAVPKTMHYIFSEWLPNSDFEIDHRPHFEVLGEKYKNDDPKSEEEVWIPIKKKTN